MTCCESDLHAVWSGLYVCSAFVPLAYPRQSRLADVRSLARAVILIPELALSDVPRREAQETNQIHTVTKRECFNTLHLPNTTYSSLSIKDNPQVQFTIALQVGA